MAKAKQVGQQCQIVLNDEQREAMRLAGHRKHKRLLFYGSAGSGKSYLIQYLILLRAQNAAGSRHIILRLTLDSCRQTLFDKTMREVFEAAYPGLLAQCKISESEMTVELPNGSMLFYRGLNDQTRLTKILGDEYNTVWLNECNEFSYKEFSILVGRLRYKSRQLDGLLLKNQMYADCNPASKRSWEYQFFQQQINPSDGDALEDTHENVSMKLHTKSNLANLDPDYIKSFRLMSAADRLRYQEGDWSNDTQGGLFRDSDIVAGRIPCAKQASVEQKLEALGQYGKELRRIGIAVDPAVSNNKNSDESGITVEGVDRDGHGYVLDDLSQKGSPEAIARKAIQAFDDWDADFIIIEKNNGGDWLPAVFYGIRPNVPIKLVHASKGKLTRAEPISALYERHRVHHVGSFPVLESQMTEFGSSGAATKSPDRMDSMVWGLTELCDINGDRTHRTCSVVKAKGAWGV